MNNILQKGIEIAKSLETNKYRLVAIITNKRGHILSIGCNSYEKTHPRQAYFAKKYGNKFRIYLHAEIDALIKCKGNPHAIWIARVNNKGEPLLARPCNICQMAICDAGIEEIYFTGELHNE